MTRAEVSISPFLTAQWRDLLMLNYVVDPRLLEPLVPAGTSLDRWHGQALVSVVGFRFVDTRVLGLRIPGHRDFEEINLRFYVFRATAEGIRRAVVFIRELVPRRAIAWMAHAWYNEPYRAVPMRHTIDRGEEAQSVRYEWNESRNESGEWRGLSARTMGPASALAPGSEAEFITEHYWGYTRQRDGGTIEYQVAHPAWRVWEAREPTLYGDMTATYGSAFAAALAVPPRSGFVADGSPVTVFRPRRLLGTDVNAG